MTARLTAYSVLVLLLSMSAASAATPTAKPASNITWPGCDNFADTLAEAAKKYKPVTVLYVSGSGSESTSKKEEMKPKIFEFSSSYDNMIDVRIDSLTNDAAFLKLVGNLCCKSFPMILICDGRGRILGVFHEGTVVNPGLVKENDARPRHEQAATAWAIVNWEKSVDGQLPSLDEKLKKQQYAEYFDLLAAIDAQDKKFSILLSKSVPWQPADQHFPWFYEKEVKDALGNLRDAINKELDADQALLEAGQYKPAQESLARLLFFKDDPDLSKKIAALKNLLDKHTRLAAKAAPISATSAAPAAAK